MNETDPLRSVSFVLLFIDKLFVLYDNLTISDTNKDCGIAAHMTIENGLREEIYEFFLHESFDRAGSISRLISFSAHIINELFCKFD